MQVPQIIHEDPQSNMNREQKPSCQVEGAYGEATILLALSLLESSNDMIAALDSGLHFVAFNAAFQREFDLVYGKSVSLGERLDEALSHLECDRKKAVELCQRAFEGESFRVVEDFGDEEQFQRKAYEIGFSPILGTQSNPLFIAVVVRDMTLLHVSERRFGALLEASPDPTIIMRSDGTIDLANARAERMFGYDRDQMLDISIESLMPDRFRNDHTVHRMHFDQQPSSRQMGKGKTELFGLRKDGTEFPIEISLNPLDVGGESMVIAAIRDMTQRQQAEDQLRRLSAELEQRVIERTAELEQANRDVRVTFEQAAVGIAHVAPDGTWLRVNQELCKIVGYSKEEMLGMKFQDITHPDDLESDLELAAHLLIGDIASGEMEKRYLHKDGHTIWISLNASVVRNSHGEPEYFISVVKDINDRKHAEAQLQESKQALELAIAATGLGMFDFFPQTDTLLWTREAKRHFGLSPDATVNFEVFMSGLHPDDRERMNSVLQRAMQPSTDGHYHIEYRTIGIEDYQERWIEARGRVFFDEFGKPVRFIGATLDITANKESEERIRQMSLHDPLTGLPNRALLFQYAEHVFGRARRTSRHCAVLFIDLDRFKPINDNHGHEVGDAVLKEVARRLISTTRAEDVVFRLGGDEFIILLSDIEADTNAGDVARHMAELINQPYHVDPLELALSTSIGISIFPRDGEDIDTLINHADSAMYQAKQAGRNNIQFYSQELAIRSRKQSMIEEWLKTTLNHDGFELYYQPVMDMQSARIIGVEALLRWAHTEVGPEQFVPIAEATGQINRLGEWVIDEACRQHKIWREHGLPTIPIAVNVSAVQFRQKDFVEHFAQTMHDWHIDKSALQVELTETALMENFDRAIDVLTRLQALGIKIALDDFGTGYSSLNYLSRLPINKIKVDKSFVQRIEHDKASRAITEAVIALGRTLQLEVVAEGIESKEALQYLRRHGCNQAQGFYVCEPVSADHFESWYREHCNTYVQ
jgi:diguanylate cyclase (GGDEF)-like protein/PAS domain S-box-containing protein